MTNKENMIIRNLKGFGNFVLSQFLSAFLVFALIAVARDFLLAKIFIGLASLFITLGLFFNWSYNAAKRDMKLNKYHNMKYDKTIPIKMAIFAPITTYISFIVLVLSYVKIIPDFFNIFLLSNMFLTPIVDTFTDGRTVEFLNLWGIFGILVVILTQPITIILTYHFVYHEIDFIKFLVYKK